MSSNVIHLPTIEEAEDLILPGSAVNMLLKVLTEMAKGNAMTLMPINAELSTQQTAKLLNVSRPYLVNLLEKGAINFRKVGSHRRVMAQDVFEYKQRMDSERLKVLDELASQAQEHEMGYE